MSEDPLSKVRMSRYEALADDAETDALWAKFAESINRVQKKQITQSKRYRRCPLRWQRWGKGSGRCYCNLWTKNGVNEKAMEYEFSGRRC